MNILNEYFDKIYCITVHDFLDRHELVKTQLKGINFEWIFSPPPFLIKSSKLTSTEISLISGHMSCICNAKINGYKRIAIWEDDSVLISSQDAINNFLNNLPSNWDCLYMGNASSSNFKYIRTEIFSNYINKIYWATGSSFNGIQYHVYDDLIKEMLNINEPVDFNYYKIFERGNSYSPSNKYISDSNVLPSRIIHTHNN